MIADSLHKGADYFSCSSQPARVNFKFPTLRESTSSPMSPSRRRRGSSPDSPSKRRRIGSSSDPSPKGPRTGSRSRSDSRHRRRSPSRSLPSSHPPRRASAPVFPSHHDHPDLPDKLRVLCEIVSSPSHSLLSLLDNTGIRVTQYDVETVLRLSYSHPGPALTFFRWAGERHLDHMHSPYAWNLVVDMLGKNLHFDTMWDTVCSMRDLNLLSLATFASIFASLAADGRAEEALAAFRVLPLYGIPRDTVALNSLLAAMCRAGLLRDARAVLHESVMAGVRLDVDSFAVLLEGCENEKDAKFAQKVFDDMVTTIGWNPVHRPAYDSFLVTLLSSHDDGFVEAMRYLEDLRRHGCSSGPKFFRTALQLCHDKSDIRGASALWEDYIERGLCPPDTTMYNYIIALFCKDRRPEKALRYFDEMVLHGAFPDADTHNMLFQMLVRERKVREAMAVLNDMLNNECFPTHTNCLLAFNTKDLELCIKVWQCMLKHGNHPLEEAGNLLVSMLDGLELLPKACKYAEDLIDNGVKLSSANLEKLKRNLKRLHKDKIRDHFILKWKQRLVV